MSVDRGRLDGVARIAVLRPNAVGDFVFALPALHALKQAYPDAELVLLGKAWHAGFLAARPGPVDRVEVMPPVAGVGVEWHADVDERAVDAFVARMRAERFDIVAQMYGGGRYSNPFARRLGGRLAVGWRALGAAPLDRSVAHVEPGNRRLALLEIAALVGATQMPASPELEVTQADREEAEQVLSSQDGQGAEGQHRGHAGSGHQGTGPESPGLEGPGHERPRHGWPLDDRSDRDRLSDEGPDHNRRGKERSGRTGRDGPRQARSDQERPGHERPGHEWPGHERPGLERPSHERTGSDHAHVRASSLPPPASAPPLVVLQPGASDPRRCWPAERFAALGDALAAAGARVAVNGTAQEARLVRHVVHGMRYGALDLSGKLGLGGLCGLLERAALLVSNDTGPLHLALAIGTPAVGIFWHTNLVDGAPLRPSALRAAVSARVHCPVCGLDNRLQRCTHQQSFVRDVSVDEVIGLAISLLDLGPAAVVPAPLTSTATYPRHAVHSARFP